MENTLIQLSGAVFEYSSYLPGVMPVRAIDHVDMSVYRGSFTVVLGRNGSGKSTLSRLMNALLLPKEGTVVVDGLISSDDGLLWQIRKTVGVVFQNPDNQIVATTVEEDVAFGPENLGVPPDEIRSRIDDALKQVDMLDYMGHSPHMLSGGQKQRVAIAGILAMKPSCIVLDEATSMLDPQGRLEVLTTIHQLNREHGIAVVLITHHMAEAVEADHVFVMQKGKLVFEGSPSSVFSQVELLRDAGLDVPSLTSLAYMTKSLLPKMTELPINMEQAIACFSPIVHGFSGKLENRQQSQIPETDQVLPVQTQDDIIISVKNVSHIYMQGTTYERVAVDDVTLDIRKGEILGIVGHTGSGKSTLVQHFNGLLKPTSGTVLVAGLQAEGKTLKELRKKVGLIFQYPEHQLFDETVSKDIAFGLHHMGLSKEEIETRIQKVAQLVGLGDDLLQKSPFELSGGQKRRAAIAGVLAMEPEILILDEPTAGLDPRGSAEIYAILEELNRTMKTTMVLISHSMEDIAMHADRVAVMHHGQLVMLDVPRVIFAEQERMNSLRLGVPAVTALFSKLLPDHEPILTVAEGAATLAHMIQTGVTQ